MKKTAIALLTLAQAVLATSCQKMEEPTLKSEAMTISAVSEGMVTPQSKAEMAYRYDVLWNTDDKILVKNASQSVEFILSSGEGTTKGTFSSQETISGEVEAFYPASIVDNGDLVWPATWTNNQVAPMYCKTTISGTENVPMSFASLGSVLQLVFSTERKGFTLESIHVSADEPMSGTFTVDESGQAIIDVNDANEGKGVTLDLGEGVAVGTTAQFFYIPIPSGTYHNLTITFTATDGSQCIKKATSQTINFNSVARLALSEAEPLPSVEQVEMNVVVPIHPSSLEYFDYVVRYSDNYGTDKADTIRFDYDDWEVKGLDENNCYTRTFSYDALPIASTVLVEMIPRKERSSMVSFNFYTPKPYLFPDVRYSNTSVKRETPYRITDGLEVIRIDNMSIGSFQSLLGDTFFSKCGVYGYDDGYEYLFY